MKPCDKCCVQAECAWNNWCLFDSDNPYCPNYAEGIKQLLECEEEEKRERRLIDG